jgi:ABC-type bacteriocin/lantibiotic exporter with double-glycine peptidase domain
LDLLRAIFQKKSILVLDEATSHLDFNLQLKINDYFYSLKQTIVISSHQLDFIQRADRVIFLSGAGKVEIGPHAHLLRHSHTYRLFMKEMNGDEENAH